MVCQIYNPDRRDIRHIRPTDNKGLPIRPQEAMNEGRRGNTNLSENFVYHRKARPKYGSPCSLFIMPYNSSCYIMK